jgi:hypothetical protein
MLFLSFVVDLKIQIQISFYSSKETAAKNVRLLTVNTRSIFHAKLRFFTVYAILRDYKYRKKP